MKRIYFATAAIIFFITIRPAVSFSATETFGDSVDNAIEHAGGTGPVDTKWLADSGSIISINSSDNHGLTYDSSGYLITRTAAGYADWMSGLYVQNGYAYRPTADPGEDTAAWVTVGDDCTRFLKANGVTGSNVIALLERGLGINNVAGSPHNVIIEYAVDTSDPHFLRPTKNPDVTAYAPSQYGNDDTLYPFADGTSTDFQNFYAAHRTAAYESGSPFPWTQLGYTYFWGNGPNPPSGIPQIKGMTEFVILAKTTVNLVGIYTTVSYIYTENNGQ